MRKFYVEISELKHDDENCASWTETLAFVVMYAPDDGACYDAAKLLYEGRGVEIGFPTEEEPK